MHCKCTYDHYETSIFRFRMLKFYKFQFPMFLKILYMFDPYTTSELLPHSFFSWKIHIWYTGIPVSTLISEWEPMNASLGVHQIKNFLGIVHLVPPPSPLYQMEHFQELFHLVQQFKVQTFVGCPSPFQSPTREASRPTQMGGLSGRQPPPQ